MLCTKLSRCEEKAFEMIHAVESGILPKEGVGLWHEHTAVTTAQGAIGQQNGACLDLLSGWWCPQKRGYDFWVAGHNPVALCEIVKGSSILSWGHKTRVWG